jgi:hypothetical protein
MHFMSLIVYFARHFNVELKIRPDIWYPDLDWPDIPQNQYPVHP